MTTPATHTPESWFWEAGSDDCPHGPEPDRNSDAWDNWAERHTGSPQDVFICLDTPAGDACGTCSEDTGEYVPWSACLTRPRALRKDTPMPKQPTIHRPITVLVGGMECLERECEEYFTDEGDEDPGVERCSHVQEREICEACSPVGDLTPVVLWTDCPANPAA